MRAGGWPARLVGPELIAVLTWLLLTPLALVLVRAVDLNPLTTRGALMPLAVGGAAAVAVLVAYFVRPSARVAGFGAGLYAAWVALVIFSAFHGTPFGDSGLRGDTARLTAAVTRFSVTWHPVDAIVPSVPSEYPPLFPWLIARAADVIGRPGWSLVGDAEALAISLGVVGGFVLWRRLVGAPVAALLAIIPPFVFGQPRKSYEILVLCLFTPWVLATFSRHRQAGGLSWLPAGLLLGLFLQTYQAFLVFEALGIVVLAAMGLRASPVWRAYARHLLLTGLVAALAAAWYLVPFLHGVLAIGGSRVNDVYVAGEISADPLGTHLLLGSGLVGVLRLVGLLGMVLLQGRQWWARPLLVLVLGAYAYRLAYVFVFVNNGHTGYLDYTSRLLGTLLMTGGVLSVAALDPVLSGWLPDGQLARLRQVGAVVLVAPLMFGCWALWTPSPVGLADAAAHPVGGKPNLATFAHVERLPDGRAPRYAADIGVESLPITKIADVVAEHPYLGSEPATLSYSERLFAYLPWTGYVAVDRGAANTFSFFDERFAAVSALADRSDPRAFADASAHLPHGRIDVFVLRDRKQQWTWSTVTFVPAQFSPAYWDVRHLRGVVVVVRRA